MAKVFRLFQDRDLYHWQDRNGAYGSKIISHINNPDGNKSIIEPTSIPSPFARIDLPKTAFAFVANSDKLNDNTIYHKVVSDCLDIGEIFFNYSQISDSKLKILSWDKNKDLKNLINSTNPKHKLFGETLDLFLNQDGSTYHFDQMNHLYFLLYDSKVIGSTSPATLFFTSANDLSFVKIPFGDDKVFDNNYQPLYKRDPEYQKYLHLLFNANSLLKNTMPEFDAYLSANLNELNKTNSTLYTQINNLIQQPSLSAVQQALNNYDLIPLAGAGNNVEVFGIALREKPKHTIQQQIEQNSGFIIASPKNPNSLKPLILPNYTYTDDVIYTIDNKWDSNTIVSSENNKSLDKRILPGQIIQYPYLTVSDFLEPYLIKLPYTLNKEAFFDGNLKDGKNSSYLLPIKKLFFDYFNIDNLVSNNIANKPMLEINQRAGGVKVVLRIPIKNNKYIEFSRAYSQTDEDITNGPNLKQNKGVIIDLKLGLSIFPFFRTGKDDLANYRATLAIDYPNDRTVPKGKDHQLSFYKENGEYVHSDGKQPRGINDNDTLGARPLVIEKKEFDLIVLSAGKYQGIIIPNFPLIKLGKSKFTYAIDFGTTNTHIEYLEDGTTNPQTLELKKQLSTLHILGDKEVTGIENYLLKSQLPSRIGSSSDFHFPQRTAICHDKSLDVTKRTTPLAEMNIPFYYAKETPLLNTKIETNLKWSNFLTDQTYEEYIRSFFEELLLIIKNKIILDGGNLTTTKLICFYPSSMIEERRNRIMTDWNKFFQKYFAGAPTPKHISESIAPYYYVSKKLGLVAQSRPAITIDIGGGTTDSVVYLNNTPQILTSFRFAANSIFGDGLNKSIEYNGFVTGFKPEIERVLQGSNILSVLEEIYKTGVSSDVISFFFSLEQNKAIVENYNISFSKYLYNAGRFKPIFLIFYAAIIYHIARLMRLKGLGIPGYITFSGTGSKIINILDSKVEESGVLSDFTRLIFQKIYGGDSYEIKLMQPDNPKQLTCKGGLLADTDQIKIDNIKKVIYGGKNETTIESITYSDINDSIKSDVVDEILSFSEIFFGLGSEFDFRVKFGIEPKYLNICRAIFKDEKDIRDYLDIGLHQKLNELSSDNLNLKIDETFFFYPFIGLLNEIAYQMTKEN